MPRNTGNTWPSLGVRMNPQWNTTAIYGPRCRLVTGQNTPAKTNLASWKIPIFNRKYIGSFMERFSSVAFFRRRCDSEKPRRKYVCRFPKLNTLSFQHPGKRKPTKLFKWLVWLFFLGYFCLPCPLCFKDKILIKGGPRQMIPEMCWIYPPPRIPVITRTLQHIFGTRSQTNPIHLPQGVDPNYTPRWSFLNLPSSLKLTAKTTENGWLEDHPFLFGHLFFHHQPPPPKKTPRTPQTHRPKKKSATPPPWKSHVHDTSIIFKGVGRRLRATFWWEAHERLVL